LWLNLRRIRAAYRVHPEWGRDFVYQLAKAIGLAVALLLFEGLFGHNLYRYTWLWYGGFLVISAHCVGQRLSLWPRRLPATPQPRMRPRLGEKLQWPAPPFGCAASSGRSGRGGNVARPCAPTGPSAARNTTIRRRSAPASGQPCKASCGTRSRPCRFIKHASKTRASIRTTSK